MVLKTHTLGHTIERDLHCASEDAQWRLCLVKVLSNFGETMEFPVEAEQQCGFLV